VSYGMYVGRWTALDVTARPRAVRRMRGIAYAAVVDIQACDWYRTTAGGQGWQCVSFNGQRRRA
jgi:hypothetical protein